MRIINSFKIYLITLIVMSFGCTKDIFELADKVERVDEVIWNPHIAVPLVYSRIGIESLLGQYQNQFLYVMPDKSIEVGYIGNVFSKRAYEVFNFPNQQFDYDLDISPAEAAALMANDSIIIIRDFTFQMTFPGDFEVDSLLISNGELNINTSSTLRHKTVIEMALPDLIKNNQSQNIKLDMTYAGSSPIAVGQTINLANSKLDLTNGPNNHSTLRVNIAFRLYKTNTNPITGTETISFNMGMNNVRFSRLHFFAPAFDLRSDENEFEIGLFDQTSGQGNFSLADPRLKVIISNSFGIPINYNLIKFDGTNTAGNTVSLTGTNIGTPQSLPFPGNDYFNVYKDSFEINKNTTNIVNYLRNQPFKNEFDFNVLTAPSTGSRYWMNDSSVVKFDVEIVVPLHGTAENIVFERTQPIDFGISEPEELEELQLRLYTENGFPVGVNLQVYFIDSTSNQILDSLFVDNTIFLNAADVNSAGRVTTPGKRLLDIKIDKSRINNALKANQVRFTSQINTTKDGSGQYKDVKFYSDYDIMVQLGIQAKILIKYQQ